jgi:uncharacterized protein
MTQQPQPVRDADRILTLDVLRGLAILGILMVNAPAFAMPFEVSGSPNMSPLPFESQDGAVWWTMRTFFQQKFVTLFSMLFGVSVFLVGGERHDPDRSPVLRRRLMWLTLFGLIHGSLIWYGDILLLYGLMGFVFMLCRSWGARRLATVGVLLIALASLVVVGLGFAMTAMPAAKLAEHAPNAAEIAETIAGFRGDIASVQAANFEYWRFVVFAMLFLFGPMTIGLMMIGLALFKAGVLQGRASTRTYVLMVLGGAVSLAIVGWAAAREMALGFPFPESKGVWEAPNALLAPLITLGYVGLICLAMRAGWFRPVAAALGSVGRMAFTNYLTQSLIMTAIFYGGGRGLGLFGTLDWPQWTAIVAGVWVLQLLWSPLWLSRFRMGPFEWVWRRLSYGRPIPLRRDSADGAVVA